MKFKLSCIAKISLLLSVHNVQCMEVAPTSLLLSLPEEIVVHIIAACTGQAKNALRYTRKSLYALATYANPENRKRLILHNAINLSNIEKHLLLIEYVQDGDGNIIKRLFELGASPDVLKVLGSYTSDTFPKNRSPTICTEDQQTLVFRAVGLRKLEIAKIILDATAALLEEKSRQLLGGKAHLNQQEELKSLKNLINKPTLRENTPLFIAILSDYAEMITLLFSYPTLPLEIDEDSREYINVRCPDTNIAVLVKSLMDKPRQ